MKGSAAVSQVKVSADGQGVVSHAGVGMLLNIDSALRQATSPSATRCVSPPWLASPLACASDKNGSVHRVGTVTGRCPPGTGIPTRM